MERKVLLTECMNRRVLALLEDEKLTEFHFGGSGEKGVAAWVKFMSEEYGKSFRISVAHLLKLQMVSNAILRWMENIPRFSPIRLERSHL